MSSLKFSMDFDPFLEVFRYDVAVLYYKNNHLMHEVTNGVNEGLRTQRRVCAQMALMEYMSEHNPGVDYVYDGKHLLWTTRQVARLDEIVDPRPHGFLNGAFAGRGDLMVRLEPKSRSRIGDLRPFERVILLELLTSQTLIESHGFANVAKGCLFSPSVEENAVKGFRINSVIRKSVQLISENHAIVDIDLKLEPTLGKYTMDQWYDLLCSQTDPQYITKFFRGMVLDVLYDPGRKITVEGFTSARDTCGACVPAFLYSKWGVFSDVSRPGVVDIEGGIFPLNLVRPVPGQLIKKEFRSCIKRALSNDVDFRHPHPGFYDFVVNVFETDQICDKFGVRLFAIYDDYSSNSGISTPGMSSYSDPSYY